MAEKAVYKIISDLRDFENNAPHHFQIDSVEMIETFGNDNDWKLYEKNTNCVYLMRCSLVITFTENCVVFS